MILRILRMLTDASLAEAIAGDLREERLRRASASAWRASVWYWSAAIGIVVHVLRSRAGEGIQRLAGRHQLVGLAGEARQALRSLARTPVAAAVVVVTLALSLGLNTAIFSVAHGVLFAPLPLDRPEEIVFIEGTRRSEAPSVFGTSYPDYLDLARDQRSFVGLATSCYWTFTVTGTAVPLRLVGHRVSGSFFPLLGARPMLGRWITPADDRTGGPEVAVISNGLWRRAFGGDPQAVGQRVMLNGRSAEIIGVMPASFAFPFEDVELWLPMLDEMDSVPRNSRFFTTVGRLRPEVSLGFAQAELTTIAVGLEERFPGTNKDWRPFLRSALATMTKEARPRLLLVVAAVLVVLVVSCVNIATLLAARVAQRRRELSVRIALGAGRWRLCRMMLLESGWLALAGAAGGLAVAFPALTVLKSLAPDGIPRISTVSISWSVAGWAGAAVAAVIATSASMSLFSLRPATLAPSAATVIGASPGWARRLLIAAQVAGACALLVGAGLLVRSFIRVLAVDPGFDAANLATLRVFLTPPRYVSIDRQLDFVTRGLELLQSGPGVVAAAAVSQPPFDTEGGGTSLAAAVDGRAYAPGTHPVVAYRPASAEYFSTLRLPLLEGRLFGPNDRRESPLVGVINRTMAGELWPGESPVGRRFEFADGRGAGWITVIGVVGNVATDGLERDEPPTVYAPFVQRSLPFVRWMTFVVRTERDVARELETLRARLQSIDPAQPIYAVRSMEQAISTSVAGRRFAVVLMLAFAAVTLVLAALGVYGNLAQRVAQRRQELGVRLALGAPPARIVRLVLAEAAALVGIGLVLGIVIALLGTPLVRDALFGVAVTDAWTWTGIVVVLALTGVLAAAGPALAAARTDPLRAVKGV